VSGALADLAKTPYTIYGDEPFDVVAVVSHPDNEVPVMTRFLPSRSGVLNSVVDNVFNAIKKDHRKLFWTARADDENRAWHFERADGSFTRAGKSLFWYGIQDVREVERAISDLEAKGRIERSFLPISPPPPAHRSPVTSGKGVGVRPFSTLARHVYTTHPPLSSNITHSRGYATAVGPSASTSKRVALIGARGYTGQALVNILSTHPNLELAHVSSRELAGFKLTEYSKNPNLKYEALSVEDVERMEEHGRVDAWIMALPNGVCKPFVDAIDRGAQKHSGTGNKPSVVIDLSADYRFEDGWTYGLPGAAYSVSKLSLS